MVDKLKKTLIELEHTPVMQHANHYLSLSPQYQPKANGSLKASAYLESIATQ